MEQNFLSPLVYEPNLNVQYEFQPRWVLELGYVGTHGYHLAVGSNSRPINEAQLSTASNFINGVNTNTTSNASLRVPYLAFSPSGLPNVSH